jgi:hypothetical protein
LLLHQRRTPWPPHCNTWSDVVAASSMVATDVAVSLVETLYASALQSSHSTTVRASGLVFHGLHQRCRRQAFQHHGKCPCRDAMSSMIVGDMLSPTSHGCLLMDQG